MLAGRLDGWRALALLSRDDRAEPRMPFQKIEPEKLSASVVRQIELLILRGILRPGERLPPERDLSERLGVEVMNFEVIELNYVNDLARLNVFYRTEGNV